MAYRNHLLRLSEPDRICRFHGSISDDVVNQYVRDIDWNCCIILGYFFRGVLRAAVELRCDKQLFPKSGELAFNIERLYQNKGIGQELMSRILLLAKNRHILDLHISFLSHNGGMKNIIKKINNYGIKKYVDLSNGTIDVHLRLDQWTHTSLLYEYIDSCTENLIGWLDNLSLVLSFSITI